MARDDVSNNGVWLVPVSEIVVSALSFLAREIVKPYKNPTIMTLYRRHRLPVEPERTVAFSGYRPAKLLSSSGSSEIFPILVHQLSDILIPDLASRGYDTFLCGMAEGFDLLAGRAVLEAKKRLPHLRLFAVLPFPEQADSFALEWKKEHKEILSASEGSVVTSPRYWRGCFHQRNDTLVDNASVLVCYFDGQEGGTKYTVDRALKGNHRILNLALEPSFWTPGSDSFTRNPFPEPVQK